jgi:hypothetical protein
VANARISQVGGTLRRDSNERPTMNTTHTLKRILAGALLSGGVAVAGLGLGAGTAQAGPGFVPLDAWPGCPNDHPQGPCHWYPGQPLPPTGNHVTNPVRWDNGLCHTYYYVDFGQGNVAQNIWDGDNPPAPPPPPPGLYCDLPNLTNCRIGDHP